MTFTAGNKDIGAVFKVGAELADQLVGRSLDAGINFFDAADGYADNLGATDVKLSDSELAELGAAVAPVLRTRLSSRL